MNTKDISEYKRELKLTKRQRDIVVGLLLGDGHLETQNNGRTYRLKVEHALNQSDYVLWLHGEFGDWVRQKEPTVKQRKNGGASIWFSTYSHGAFRFYAHQFYQNKQKHIPKHIGKLLTPLGLAIWFMDDGSRKSEEHKTFNIHTLGFVKKELEMLRDVLKEKFNLNTSLHKQRYSYWRIYILSESAERFRELVAPYVDPIVSMKHKLGNTLPKE